MEGPNSAKLKPSDHVLALFLSPHDSYYKHDDSFLMFVKKSYLYVLFFCNYRTLLAKSDIALSQQPITEEPWASF